MTPYYIFIPAFLLFFLVTFFWGTFSHIRQKNILRTGQTAQAAVLSYKHVGGSGGDFESAREYYSLLVSFRDGGKQRETYTSNFYLEDDVKSYLANGTITVTYNDKGVIGENYVFRWLDIEISNYVISGITAIALILFVRAVIVNRAAAGRQKKDKV